MESLNKTTTSPVSPGAIESVPNAKIAVLVDWMPLRYNAAPPGIADRDRIGNNAAVYGYNQAIDGYNFNRCTNDD